MIARWAMLFLVVGANAATLTVINTNDSGAGSLRQAIMDSNASVGVLDKIQFTIPGNGLHTIAPVTALPTITDPVTIDGYTQPGAQPNSLAADDNAVLLIEISGVSAPVSANGFLISAGNTVVRGLVINRFGSNGIRIQSNGGNTVIGCFIGTDATGSAALPNGVGINVITVGNNILGGTNPADRNVISGNASAAGLTIFSGSNSIRGNFIGTDKHGTTALGNVNGGISFGAATPLTTPSAEARPARETLSQATGATA